MQDPSDAPESTYPAIHSFLQEAAPPIQPFTPDTPSIHNPQQHTPNHLPPPRKTHHWKPPHATTPPHPGHNLEGGGQLLRLSLALAALCRIPVHVTEIRGNRSRGGGLKAQHLTSLVWLARASGARVEGAVLGSRDVVFSWEDGEGEGDGRGVLETWGPEIKIRQSTPGSVGLVLQAVLPYLLFASSPRPPSSSFSRPESESDSDPHSDSPGRPVTLHITGGTNVSASPSYDYIAQVLLPVLERIGLPRVTPTLHSRGWNQGAVCVGGASFSFVPLPQGSTLPAFELVDCGIVESVHATVVAPREWEDEFKFVVERHVRRNRELLFGAGCADEEGLGEKLSVGFQDSGHAKRVYLLLVARTSTGMRLGRDWLYDGPLLRDKGPRGKGKTKARAMGKSTSKDKADVQPTAVAEEMVRKVLADLICEVEHGGCVDEFLGDQLVVFQALAKGRSKIYGGRERTGSRDLVVPSLHARTARWVVGEMLQVHFDDEGACQGLGYVVGKGMDGSRQQEEEMTKELEQLRLDGKTG